MPVPLKDSEMVERRRRHEDPEGVDHTQERVIDWKTVAPRWVLITALVLSFGINGLLGTMLASSVTARLDQIENKYSDPKWDLLSNHGDRIGRLEVQMRQQESRINDLDVRQQLVELKAEVRIINLKLTRSLNSREE